MNSNQLRHEFTHYFEGKGHLARPSISLVPQDPTLLFTSAGMVPMKAYFLGQEEPPCRRMVTIQKCFRTTDIDNVGRTPRHLTFLEMLGNFSVGDYFKEDAIVFAWEFLTRTLGLPPNRMWVTVFREDDEAERIWAEKIGVTRSRIVRLGEADNFWGPVGTTGVGPCGPCSEIHFDLGPELGAEARPGDESDRLMEVWNLVFMEFNKEADGRLVSLAQKNIDTGMGLERLATVTQGVNSIFLSDLFRPLTDAILELAKRAENIPAGQRELALRVIADHLRATAFLVADGVVPSNEGRGYVLRRVIRRAYRHGRRLGLKGPFLHRLLPEVQGCMGSAYPELAERGEYIRRIVQMEEQRFQATLEGGLETLESLLVDLMAKHRIHMPGEAAFRLYDTFGFPLELTEEIAAEAGLTVEREGFQREMNAQQERGRAAMKKVGMAASPYTALLEEKGKSVFTGYESTESSSTLLALFHLGREVSSLATGEEGEAFLAETPFYAEKGGQVGDQGKLLWEEGKAEVLDTQTPLEGIILHRLRVVEGTMNVGQVVNAQLDLARRLAIDRAHTATHLLHQALRELLGPQTAQAGSLVEPDRLRFDYNHFCGLEEREIRMLESRVNELIRLDQSVSTAEMGMEEAKRSGAIALFGEKYGEGVRVVQTGKSRELCGGTHAQRTGQLGFFSITQETGVGSNLRRIDALTGAGAVELAQGQRDILEQAALMIHTPSRLMLQKLSKLLQEKEEERKKMLALRDRYLRQLASSLVTRKREEPVRHLVARVDGLDIEAMTILSDSLLESLEKGLVVLGSIFEEKPLLLVRVSADLVSAGYHAGQLAKELGKVLEGSGGGRPEMGRAGGKPGAPIGAALEKARELVATDSRP
jgi:alanyl-tRNA synthetase